MDTIWGAAYKILDTVLDTFLDTALDIFGYVPHQFWDAVCKQVLRGSNGLRSIHIFIKMFQLPVLRGTLCGDETLNYLQVSTGH